MPTIFEISLPNGISPETIKADLEELLEGAAAIELQPAAKSGRKGQLGQIDPAHWELIVQLLDTQAAGAAVQAAAQSVPVIIAYLLGKTGAKPKVTEKSAANDEKP